MYLVSKSVLGYPVTYKTMIRLLPFYYRFWIEQAQHIGPVARLNCERYCYSFIYSTARRVDELDFRIQNVGTRAAGSSKGEVYLATFTTQPNLIRLGEIAVPALASFAETDRSRFICSTPSHITAGSKTLMIRVDSKKQSSEWIK